MPLNPIIIPGVVDQDQHSTMADQFIGLQMLVTVRDPPARLKGTVSSVEAGAGLTLSNGMSVFFQNRKEREEKEGKGGGGGKKKIESSRRHSLYMSPQC